MKRALRPYSTEAAGKYLFTTLSTSRRISLVNKMSSWGSLVFLLAIVATTHGWPSIYWGWGSCPEVTTKSDFAVENYLGVWYQIAVYPAFFQDIDARCTQATYTESDKGPNYINVYNRDILPDGTISEIQGEAWIPDPSEPGKLLVSFSECKYISFSLMFQ